MTSDFENVLAVAVALVMATLIVAIAIMVF
jgi:hypothetical protein